MNLVRVLLVFSLALAAGVARGLEAGAAKVRLVLPAGTPLDGDAARMGRPATGDHDPLWARALYLDDGETQLFLVNLDAYRISDPLRAAVVTRAEGLAPKESIVLTATHTLHGPGGMDESLTARWTSGRFQQASLDAVADAIVTAMTEAEASKRRATLGYGTGRQRILAFNALQEEGPVDEQIGVIRVDDADGKAIAIVTNFAAPPVLVPEGFKYRFSAGYPGAYYRKMEELTDPGCVAMFMVGAAGDQRPGNPDNGEGWARIETVGEELAVGAKAVANDMTFHDATLKVSYREVRPPETFSEVQPPGSAVLQTVEVNGLLLSFVPAMPDVPLGLELRRRAIAEGYSAQFTVGLANGYIGYLASRSSFAAAREARTAPWFGPDAESWLYGQIMSLARQEAPAAPSGRDAGAGGSAVENGAMTLRGEGYSRGYHRGSTFKDEIQEEYSGRVLAPIRAGGVVPVGPHWELLPVGLLDPAPLVLPVLGAMARPWLQGLEDDLFSEVEGYAAGAQLSFDAAWLVQEAERLPRRAGAGPAVVVPSRDFMFTVLGGGDVQSGVYMAYQTAIDAASPPLVTAVEPDSGHSFLQVGLNWQLGAVAGVNGMGVGLCLERPGVWEPSTQDGLSALMLLRQILQYAEDFEGAVEQLRAAAHLRDCRVLVAGPGDDGWRTATVTFGNRVAVRETESGLHTGLDPDEDRGDPLVLTRYRTLAEGYTEDAGAGADWVRTAIAGTSHDAAPLGGTDETSVPCRLILRPDRGMLDIDRGDGSGYLSFQLKGAGQ